MFWPYLQKYVKEANKRSPALVHHSKCVFLGVYFIFSLNPPPANIGCIKPATGYYAAKTCVILLIHYGTREFYSTVCLLESSTYGRCLEMHRQRLFCLVCFDLWRIQRAKKEENRPTLTLEIPSGVINNTIQYSSNYFLWFQVFFTKKSTAMK